MALRGQASWTPATFHGLLTTLAYDLSQAALPVARSAVPSRTLASAMTARFNGVVLGKEGQEGWSDLFVPHFWAVILHDGRGPVYPGVNARYLVFFVNSRDDPRLSEGYPVDPNDGRRLTKAEFEFGIRENERRYKLNPGGGRSQYMIVMKDSHDAPLPVGPALGTFFFTIGMESFERNEAPGIVERAFERMIQQDGPGSGVEPAARIRLG